MKKHASDLLTKKLRLNSSTKIGLPMSFTLRTPLNRHCLVVPLKPSQKVKASLFFANQWNSQMISGNKQTPNFRCEIQTCSFSQECFVLGLLSISKEFHQAYNKRIQLWCCWCCGLFWGKEYIQIERIQCKNRISNWLVSNVLKYQSSSILSSPLLTFIPLATIIAHIWILLCFISSSLTDVSICQALR